MCPLEFSDMLKKIRLVNYSSSLGGSEKLFENLTKVDGRFDLITFRKSRYIVVDSLKFLLYVILNYKEYIVCSNIRLLPFSIFNRRFIFRPSTDYFKRSGRFKVLKYRLYLILFGKFCNGVIFQNEYLKRKYSRYFRDFKNVVIENPALHECIRQSNIDKYDEDNSDYESDICVAARLSLNKRHADILNAVAFLKRRPEFRIVFLGDGDQKNSLLNLANKLELNLHVLIVTDSCEYIRYIRGARLCMLNSKVEGYPNVLNDYKKFSRSFLISKSSPSFSNDSLQSHMYSVEIDIVKLAFCIDDAIVNPNNIGKKWDIDRKSVV